MLPFRRPAPKPVPAVPGKTRVRMGFALSLAARPGAVSIVVGDTELWLDPAQARELGRDLVELADDAEAPGRG